MDTAYVLDTHALLHHVGGHQQLGKLAKKLLTDKSAVLFLPTIVLAEAFWIIEKGRVNIDTNALVSYIVRDPRIQQIDLSEPIVYLSLNLTKVSEMHDRLIVAKALFIEQMDVKVQLITKDRNIVESGYISTLWD